MTATRVETDNRRVQLAAEEVESTANSYQILAKLATGGMAEIFLARGGGAGVERYCVLKRILPLHAGDVEFVQMFLDEAWIAAQLQHPNIAQVYDIGKFGDLYFFTMEYVHGETVSSLIHRAQSLRRKLPLGGVLTIAAGVAAGLHHAHLRLDLDGRALGVVHRDVSPSNLMVSYEGGVKVLDFGVAKALHRARETRSGTVKGKIGYLSPEQCMGKQVDLRSDLFSLGICFWEMLTAERLYTRASDFENMNAIVSQPPPPPSARRSEVPREIDELVLRLLAKAPGDRFQTADELGEAIEAAAAQTGSVLSSPALGRFMRELFGQRPEPWLEIAGHQVGGEAVTLRCEPLPRELASSSAGRSSALDPRAPASVAASLSAAPADVHDAQRGRRAQFDLPLAPPPPSRHAIVALGPATAPGPAAVPSEPGMATPDPVARASDLHEAVRGVVSPDAGPRPYTVWSLCLVIVVSAVIGALGFVLVMQLGSGAVVVGDLGAAKVLEPERAASVTTAALTAAEGEAATDPSLARTADAGSAPQRTGDAVADGAAIDRETPLPGTVAPPGAVAAPRSAEPPAGPARLAARRESQDSEIVRLYAAGHYYRAIAQCSLGPLAAEDAPLCLLAACHAGNEAKAHKWLAAVPPARRAQLAANCKQLGVDVRRPARPIPVADCAADPTLCSN